MWKMTAELTFRRADDKIRIIWRMSLRCNSGEVEQLRCFQEKYGGKNRDD